MTYSGSQVRIFYDGAFRLLNLVQSSDGRYVYSGGPYRWEAQGQQGTLYVNGQLADTCNR